MTTYIVTGLYIYWRFLYTASLFPAGILSGFSPDTSPALSLPAGGRCAWVFVVAHLLQLTLQRLVVAYPCRQGIDGIADAVSRVVEHGKLLLRIGVDAERTKVFLLLFPFLFLFSFLCYWLIITIIKILNISGMTKRITDINGHRTKNFS